MLGPPSPLQLVSSLLVSPTPSPAQPMSLGKRPCSPPSHGSTPVGVWHQGLVALLTSPSANLKCPMLDSTPAMSVCPHHSLIELRTPPIHTQSLCKVSYYSYFQAILKYFVVCLQCGKYQVVLNPMVDLSVYCYLSLPSKIQNKNITPLELRNGHLMWGNYHNLPKVRPWALNLLV